MRTTLTFLSIIGLLSFSNAQPVLTASTNMPVPGISYMLNYGPFISPGPEGVGQTWDLSTLVVDSASSISWVAPNSTPYAPSFPACTVAETGTAATVYFQSTAVGVHQHGYAADGVVVSYDDPGEFLPFPLAYGNTWTDAFGGQYEMDGITIERTGTITGAADGYGSLLLPNGTFTGVLRVHWQQVSEDASPMFTFQTIHDSYLYYVPGIPQPLAQLVTITSVFMGNVTVNSFAQWVAETATGESQQPTQGSFQCFPSPASDIIRCHLPDAIDPSSPVIVRDASGRQVMSIAPLKMVVAPFTLDISGLSQGIYTISIPEANGTMRSGRFMKR